MLYHKPYFREKTYLNNIRLSAKGIIDNENFDSVIIGTSMTENTSAKEADEKLGNKWINLSVWGSYLNERAIILNYLFQKKDIHQIIYTIDAFTLNDPSLKMFNHPPIDSFDFLYNNNIYNDFKVYLNKKFILCALRFSKKEECVGDVNLDKLLNWEQESKELFGGFHNWMKYKDKKEKEKLKNMILNAQNFLPQTNIDIEKNKQYIKTYLLGIIRAHPKTQFYLIIPTYSRLLYRVLYLDEEYYNKDSILFSKYQAVLKWLILETQNYPNVKIFGFDDLDYADNISNYKDPAHYNSIMNSMQLDAIKEQTHILTPQNMDNYFKTMEEKIKNYDLSPFIQYIKDNK
ncbi:hypothetical protein CQA69_00770 [Campylobacter estrildidarum]|uniref:Uncharacterized protein n=2 Tax=Campylobacter estrildidarum TaxID=2510189 RepID=A0A4U7BPH1_9BACT|nr:hypothetical protein CQA69_00770 [Campylobacter estrildidarum]